MRKGTPQIMAKCLLAMVAGVLAVGTGQLHADILSFTGDLRTDATFISCGSGCTLDAGNSDFDYAQWAAVERDFTVATSSLVQAITFSYGGGTNGHGLAIGASGFEPYLSLFDASGAFLAFHISRNYLSARRKHECRFGPMLRCPARCRCSGARQLCHYD